METLIKIALLMTDDQLADYISRSLPDDSLIRVKPGELYKLDKPIILLTDTLSLTENDLRRFCRGVFFIDREKNSERQQLVNVSHYTGYIALAECPKSLLTARIKGWQTLLQQQANLYSSISLERYHSWRQVFLAQTPLSILCVDDDPLVFISLEHLFQEIFTLPVILLTADTPAQALAITQQSAPFVIFLDVYLGNKEIGYDVFDQLPENTHCLYMSAHFSSTQAVEEIQAGALDFLAKPLTPVGHRNLLKFYLDILTDLYLIPLYLGAAD